MSLATAEILVTGVVQGVGFRYFCLMHAQKLNLNGWVKNLPNGKVMATIEGDKDSIELFYNLLTQGPANSSVEHTDIKWATEFNGFVGFKITSS